MICISQFFGYHGNQSDTLITHLSQGLYELIPTKVEYYNHLEGSYETMSLIDEHELIDLFVTEEADELTDD